MDPEDYDYLYEMTHYLNEDDEVVFSDIRYPEDDYYDDEWDYEEDYFDD